MSDNLFHFPSKGVADKSSEGNHNGGNGGGNEMEARVAKLEAHFEYIRRDLDTLKGDVSEFRTETKTSIGKVRDNLERDFRLVFGVVIVVALGLAGLMAKGFHWI